MARTRGEQPQMPNLPDLFGNQNNIQTAHHSLFWEEQPAEESALNIKLTENGPEETVTRTTPGYTLYKLFIGAFDSSATDIQRIVNQLHKANHDDFLEIHIASNGGSLDELLILSNAINNTFVTNVATYIDRAYSAGAMISLIGQTRVVYEDSDWMAHSYSGGSWGKREDLLNHLLHSDRVSSKYMMRTLGDYLTPEEITQMQGGKDFWFDSKEMLKRGIATHILVEGRLMTQAELKQFKKDKKKAQKKAQKKVAKVTKAKIAKEDKA